MLGFVRFWFWVFWVWFWFLVWFARGFLFFSCSQCQAVSERGVRLPCFGLAVLVPRGLVGGKAFLCNPFSLGSRPCDLQNSLVSPTEPVNLISGPELGNPRVPLFPARGLSVTSNAERL